LENLNSKAKLLSKSLSESCICNNIIPTKAECGGGTLPNISINSYAVQITEYTPKKIKLDKNNSKTLYNLLLAKETPIVSMIRKGSIILDILALDSNNFSYISRAISECFKRL